MGGVMADDWIKMRGALVDHPKVIAMARALHENNDFRHWLTPGAPPASGQTVSTRALRCVTTALLMCVWSVSRATGRFVGDDLHLPHSTLPDLDEIAGAPGVGAAMVKLGWVVELAGNAGLCLPNFKEFNVPKTNAEKQKDYRDRTRSVTSALPERGNENRQSVTPRGRGRGREEPSTDTPPHTTPDAPAGGRSGVFEGHTTPAGVPSPAAVAAIALTQAGLRVTSQNPDLIAAVEEGITVQHLLEVLAAYPNKPIKYLCTVARRERTEKAADIGPAAPRAPSKQASAIRGVLGRFHESEEDSHGDSQMVLGHDR